MLSARLRTRTCTQRPDACLPVCISVCAAACSPAAAVLRAGDGGADAAAYCHPRPVVAASGRLHHHCSAGRRGHLPQVTRLCGGGCILLGSARAQAGGPLCAAGRHVCGDGWGADGEPDTGMLPWLAQLLAAAGWV